MNIALWTAQVLLAALFLFTGGMKLVSPIEEMTREISMPGWFLRFIGVSEVLGAVGLVFPWLFQIRPGLTPLAAACLLVIMIGAVATTLAYVDATTALIPLLAGVLLAFIVYGRWRPSPPGTGS